MEEREEMKFISWNVNGIRACVQKGFMDFFKEADADIFCLQESSARRPFSGRPNTPDKI